VSDHSDSEFDSLNKDKRKQKPGQKQSQKLSQRQNPKANRGPAQKRRKQR